MICDPFSSFEFCAISLLSQPAESRNEISPSKKKNGVFKFQLFFAGCGKNIPTFVQIMPQERSLLKSTKSFSKAKSKSAGYFFSQPLLFGERRKIVLPMLFWRAVVPLLVPGALFHLFGIFAFKRVCHRPVPYLYPLAIP